MRYAKNNGTGVEPIAYTTKQLQDALGAGYAAAVAFGRAADAEIRIGKSVRWNRAKIMEALDKGVKVSTKRNMAV